MGDIPKRGAGALMAALLLPLVASTPGLIGGAALAEDGNARVVEKRSRGETRAHAPLPNAITFGPMRISSISRGRSVAGRLKFSVVAVDEVARGKIRDGEDAVYGIIYPLAIKLYEDGRPSTSAIRTFKSDAEAQLNSRFGGAVKMILLDTVY